MCIWRLQEQSIKGINQTLVVLTHWRERWKGSCALILIHPCGVPNGLKISLSAGFKNYAGKQGFQSKSCNNSDTNLLLKLGLYEFENFVFNFVLWALKVSILNVLRILENLTFLRLICII